MALTRLGLNQAVNLSSNVTGTLATGNGGTGATSFAPGKIGQIVQGDHGSEKANTSTTFATTGVTASITPSASSSTILVMVHINGCAKFDGSNAGLVVKVFRGTSASDTEVCHITDRGSYTASNGNYNWTNSASISTIDSPSTTSATTYTAFFKNSVASGQVRIQDNNVRSTITLMEILA